MADWMPVEKVSKNEKGEYQALVNGDWTPVDKVAKNAEGKYMAFGVKSAPTPAAPTPAAEEGGVLDYLQNKFRKGLAGLPAIGPLAADVVNMPLRPYARALGLGDLGGTPGGGFVQFPATEQYSRAVTSAGVYDPNKPIPRDATGQPSFSVEVGGNIAEMAGMNVLPGAGVVARSATPGVALAKELAGTALSGEGMTMGKYLAGSDLFGGPSPRNEAIGEALGSMTGPMLVQKAIDAAVKGGNWVSKAGIPVGLTKASREEQLTKMAAEQQEQAKKIAAGRLQPQLETEAARQTIARSQDLSRRIPGFGESLTLGRVTGSPAIKSMEQHFASTDPEMLELASKREQGLNEAIRRYSESRFPASDWSAQDELKYIYGNRLRSFDEGLKRLDRQERKLAASLPRGDIESIGDQQRKLVAERMSIARQKADTLYREVRDTADKAGVKVNMSDVADLAKSSVGSDFRRFQDDPGILGKILRQYAPAPAAEAAVKTTPSGGRIFSRPTAQAKPPMASYGEFESLYREANREARTLGTAASAGDLQAAQKLPAVNSLRDLLRTKLDEMAKPEYGEVGKKLQTANAYYRDQYANMFKRGVGAEVLKEGRFGPATENAKLTESLIFKRGDPSGVTEFLNASGGDPRGKQLLENGVFDMLSKKVVRDGKVSKTALEGFLRDYKEPLSVVPDTRKKIENVASATRSLQENTNRALAGQTQLARSTLASAAKEENPAKIIANAIKSPKYLETILDNTGIESRKDVARGVMEQALGTPNATEFMTTNEKALKKILGTKQYANLKTIAQAREIAESVRPPGYVQYQREGDVLSKFGTTVPQAVSDIKGVLQKRAGSSYISSLMGTRWWNKLRADEVDRLMKSAVFDPELARSIAEYSANGTANAAKALDDHLIAHGLRSVAVTLRGLGQEDQQQTGAQ